jgi:hypothetical protein
MSMQKVAQGALRYCGGSVVGAILKLAEEPLTRDEKKALRSAARQLPKTPKEVEQIAGRGLTRGQVVRRVGIGTGILAAGGLARRGLTNPKAFTSGVKGLKQLVAPKEIASDIAGGLMLYGLAPGAIRQADIEAAKRGKF